MSGSLEGPATPERLSSQYLEERGISLTTIQAHGIEIDTHPSTDRMRERLRFGTLDGNPISWEANALIWFPCRDAAGQVRSWVTRLLPQIGEVKFLTPKNADPFPFVPAQTWEAQEKTHKPIVITEGPVKALALLQAGALPIGFPGVWNGTVRPKNDQDPTQLCPALEQFRLSGRTIYLAYDQERTH